VSEATAEDAIFTRLTERFDAALFERACLSGIPEAACNDSVEDGPWWAGEDRVLNCIDASYGRKWGSNQWYAHGHVIVDPDGRPRRASVLEVERCFGFPDNYTAIPGAKDDPRYKALGNSMAVPVMRWIGTRIAMVDAVQKLELAA
jgi:C-5 cytosine-specific DNA methylase